MLSRPPLSGRAPLVYSRLLSLLREENAIVDPSLLKMQIWVGGGGVPIYFQCV